jgi:hypothetical protein
MNGLFLTVRVLHVFVGATWLGVAVFASFFVMPAIKDSGPEGGKVMAALAKRGLVAFIPSIAGLTVLSGIYLYWHFTDGFDPAISGSMGGRVFGAGGLLGLIAAIIGGSVVSRSMKKGLAIMGQVATTTDPAARASLLEQAGQLRQRAGTAGRIVAVLLTITIMLMALGHYV